MCSKDYVAARGWTGRRQGHCALHKTFRTSHAVCRPKFLNFPVPSASSSTPSCVCVVGQSFQCNPTRQIILKWGEHVQYEAIKVLLSLVREVPSWQLGCGLAALARIVGRRKGGNLVPCCTGSNFLHPIAQPKFFSSSDLA